MKAAARIGILGGTLDPIHLGHLETAIAARDALGLDRVLVVPSHVPPHRAQQPVASGYHRFAMAALAINGVERLAASDLELCSPGPSYTADTLERFAGATGVAALQLYFITGADAFAEIATWHRYPEVLELAHFVVVSRPGFPVGHLASRLPWLPARVRGTPPGPEGPESPSIFLLDAPTPDVSSTTIRQRIRDGRSLAGLVSAAVETHIHQHDLYVHASTLTSADHLHGKD